MRRQSKFCLFLTHPIVKYSLWTKNKQERLCYPRTFPIRVIQLFLVWLCQNLLLYFRWQYYNKVFKISFYIKDIPRNLIYYSKWVLFPVVGYFIFFWWTRVMRRDRDCTSREISFHLKRFLSAYISELRKCWFHVEIFRQTGLFKNCDNRYKTINYINSKHFYFSKLSLLFWSLAWKIHWAPLKLAVCSSSHCASLVLELHLLTSPLLYGCVEGQKNLHLHLNVGVYLQAKLAVNFEWGSSKCKIRYIWEFTRYHML